jgi:membrane protease YdiL (CAAX protease family)
MGRLQRDHDADTTPVSTFGQVLSRHGLLMGVIALSLVLVTGVSAVVLALEPMAQRPTVYLAALAVILGLFFAYLKYRTFPSGLYQLLWIVYLLYISVVEEMAFRLYLPSVLESSLGSLAAVVLSNGLFGAIHYFTLRWKLSHCVVTALGGIGLSRLLESSGDLVLVILVHFVATFLNTPRAPDGPA